MFRNLAIALVSVCAVSTGSPAWSQNSPVEPTSPSGRQYAPSNFAEDMDACYKKRDTNNYPNRTTQIKSKNDSKQWIQRGNKVSDDRVAVPQIFCWTRDDGDGDPVSSMIYRCNIN
jgi:hypothetical protein